MRSSGHEATSNGRVAVRSTGDAFRAVGSGISSGVVAGAHATAAGFRYTQHAISDRDDRHLRQAREQREHMNARGRHSGERFRDSGGDAVRAARATGRTAVGGAGYVVQSGEHAVGATRRATGERPDVDREVMQGK